MVPTPVLDSFRAFAKKHKTHLICINYTQYAALTLEWRLLYQRGLFLNMSVKRDRIDQGIFAKIDNIELMYDGGQDEEMIQCPPKKLTKI